MPCRDENHIHIWPTEGTLEICKCEIFCGFCTGDAAKVVYEYPWQLRGHIREHAQMQGLELKVSPQPPKTHVNPVPTKRKLTEVESSENEAEEDSDEVEDDSIKDEDYEDGTKKGKSKAKPRSSTTKPLSNTSAGPDDESIDSSQGSLRLRAKPAAKAKKDSVKSHAASFQPVGPKPGAPSPKRTKQTPVMGPPASMNIPGFPPQFPPSQARLQYLQRLQDSAGATSAPMNVNGQDFAGHPQQNTNNMRPHPGNMGHFPGNMAPHPGNMGHFPGNMGRPAVNTGPRMGNTNLFSNNTNLFSSSRGPRSESSEISPRTRIPPRTNVSAPSTNMRPPINNTAPPIRWLTTSLLTQNLPAEDIIAMYQGEIEHLRAQRMYTAVMQQVRSQWMQQQGGQVYGVRYGQQNVQQGLQQGGLQQRSQMGGLQPGAGVGFGVQQPGLRGPTGGQQPAGQHVAVQQSVTQLPAAIRSGVAPAVVDPVLPPQQAPSAEEKTLSHNKAD